MEVINILLNFFFFNWWLMFMSLQFHGGNKVVKHSWIPLNSFSFSKFLLCAVAIFLTISLPSFLLSRWVFFFNFYNSKYYEIVVRNLTTSHPVWSCKPYHFWILIPYPFSDFCFLTFCLELGYSWLTTLW